MEVGALVGGGAGHPQHVHAGVADPLQRRPQALAVGGHADEVVRRPNRAAGEDTNPVEVQVEPVALDLVLRPRRLRTYFFPHTGKKYVRAGGEVAEADPAGVDRQLARGTGHPQLDRVQGGLAVGVRPPAGDARDDQLAVHEGAAGLRLDGEGGGVLARRSGQLDRNRARGPAVEGAQLGPHREDAVVAVEAGAQVEAVEGKGAAALQPDRAPGTDRRRPGGEAGRPPEQHRAEEAQVAVGELGAPPGARLAPHPQQRAQRPTADRQLVAALPQQSADVEGVRGEHRLARQDRLAVEEDLADGGDAVEPQQNLLARLRRRCLEAGAKPPVLGVEVARLPRPPATRGGERGGRGARHRGRNPVQLGARRRVLTGVGGARGRLPAGVDLHPLVALDASERRGQRRGLGLMRGHRPASRSSPPRRRRGRRSPAPGRTRGAGRA